MKVLGLKSKAFGDREEITSKADIDVVNMLLPRVEDVMNTTREGRSLKDEEEMDRLGGPVGLGMSNIGYWTSTPSFFRPSEMHIVNYHGDVIRNYSLVGDDGKGLELGIRPMIEINNMKELGLIQGDKVKINGLCYEILNDEGFALCEKCIGKQPYTDYTRPDTDTTYLVDEKDRAIPFTVATDYQHSAAKKFLDNWAVQNKLLSEEELDRRVLVDSICVISPDGTGNIETLDIHPSNKVESHPETKTDIACAGYYKGVQENATTILEAFKSGALTHAGYVDFGKIDTDKDENMYYIDFCVRSERLPKETWNALKANMPKQPCVYSGTFPAVNIMMTTYRDTCGTIGRSWENSLVQGLTSVGAHDVYQEKLFHGEYEAGLKIFKMYNDKDPIAVETYAPAEYSKEWFDARGIDVSELSKEQLETIDGNYSVLQLLEFGPVKISTRESLVEGDERPVWSIEFHDGQKLEFVEGSMSIEDIELMACQMFEPAEYSAKWFEAQDIDVSDLSQEDLDNMHDNVSITQLLAFNPLSISKRESPVEGDDRPIWSIGFRNGKTFEFVEGSMAVEDIYLTANEVNGNPTSRLQGEER